MRHQLSGISQALFSPVVAPFCMIAGNMLTSHSTPAHAKSESSPTVHCGLLLLFAGSGSVAQAIPGVDTWEEQHSMETLHPSLSHQILTTVLNPVLQPSLLVTLSKGSGGSADGDSQAVRSVCYEIKGWCLLSQAPLNLHWLDSLRNSSTLPCTIMAIVVIAAWCLSKSSSLSPYRHSTVPLRFSLT